MGIISNPSAEVIPYDFRKPIKSAQKSPLEALQSELAAELSKELAAHLGCAVDISPAKHEVMRYDEFLASLPSPTCLGVIRIDPPRAQACLEISPSLVFPMIDRVLGGTGQERPHRRLTEIERGLALGIIERFGRVLADTLKAEQVREDELLSDPRDARIMPDHELVTVMRLNASVNDNHGLIRLCLPAPVLECSAPGASFDPQVDQQNLRRNILASAVELRALLAETRLRLTDLISMQAGDVITTEVSAHAPARIEVEGQNLCAGEMGHLRGTRAIEVKRTEDLS